MIDYQKILSQNMIGVLIDVLEEIKEHGINQNQLYITFLTKHESVKIPNWLIKKYPKESYQNGISLGLYEFERIDAEVKTPYTYYGGMKAHRSLVHNGPFDEVLYTSKDEILEGTTFSFFIVKYGSVITSKLDGRILGSVTRKNLLRIMDVQKIEHSESVISINDLKSSSEAFIASANRDLIPVVSVNGNQVGDGKIGPVYKKLMSLYQQEILKIGISNK